MEIQIFPRQSELLRDLIIIAFLIKKNNKVAIASSKDVYDIL